MTGVSTQQATATLSLLGSWRLVVGGLPADMSPTGRRIVTMLAVRGPLTRAAVATALWPESGEPAATTRLRTALWRLAREHRLVESQSGELVLAVTVSVDLRQMLDTARALTRWRALPPSDVPLADLFEQDLLPTWYDDWLVVERERIRQTRLHALEALSDLLLCERRYAEAVDAGLAAVRAEPLRESAHRAVIRVHLAEGNIAEAVRQYEVCRTLLHTELGVEPSADLASLLPTRICSRKRSALLV